MLGIWRPGYLASEHFGHHRVYSLKVEQPIVVVRSAGRCS